MLDTVAASGLLGKGEAAVLVEQSRDPEAIACARSAAAAVAARAAAADRNLAECRRDDPSSARIRDGAAAPQRSHARREALANPKSPWFGNDPIEMPKWVGADLAGAFLAMESLVGLGAVCPPCYVGAVVVVAAGASIAAALA